MVSLIECHSVPDVLIYLGQVPEKSFYIVLDKNLIYKFFCDNNTERGYKEPRSNLARIRYTCSYTGVSW